MEPQTTYSEYRLAAEPCALPQFFIGAGSGWASPEATYGIICWALKKHVIKKKTCHKHNFNITLFRTACTYIRI